MSEAKETAAALVPTTSSKPSVPEHYFHKNRLQQYTQRAAIQLPIYQTINEGSPHAPRFRSTVLVDGTSYVSSETFSNRKEAEQAVAQYALKCITEKIKNEGCPVMGEDTVFCKSILNEYAVKMNLKMPSYRTTQSEGLLPMFVSSVSFNGKLYTGDAGKNKKEAEQLAARAAIKSILGANNSGTCLPEIIKSKGKFYAVIHKVKDSGASTSEKRDLGIPPGSEMLLMHAYAGACQGQQGTVSVPVSDPCIHECKKPRQEPLIERTTGCSEPSLPVPHAHQSHLNQVQDEVPLKQPCAIIFRGSSQGSDVIKEEVPLEEPSAVRDSGDSQGTVLVQNEVPLALSPAVGGSSQGAVATTDGVKISQRKNKKRKQKRFRDEGSQTELEINHTASCSEAQ